VIVVSDTSPLNYLVLIRAIEVLPALFKQVHIPPAVLHELHHPKTPELVRQWAAAPPPWLRIEKPHSQFLPSGLLDAGEMQALALARELGATALLIDERRGRKVAQENGFATFGTLTILELAAEGNLIQLRPALDALKQTSFHVSDALIQDLLARNAARKSV
jgi:predicted nucleic acid-binding protein